MTQNTVKYLLHIVFSVHVCPKSINTVLFVILVTKFIFKVPMLQAITCEIIQEAFVVCKVEVSLYQRSRQLVALSVLYVIYEPEQLVTAARCMAMEKVSKQLQDLSTKQRPNEQLT